MATSDELRQLRRKVETLEAERQRMRASLKGFEDRLRFIYESSPLGMGFINMDGILVDCNDALQDIIGAPREKLIGFKMRSGILDEAMAVAIASAFSGKIGVFEGDYTTTVSNRKISLRTIFTPLFSRSRKQTGVLFIAENISERKQTEDRLRESESRYKAIVESQAEFVVRYLPGGILTFVNDTLCRYVGMRREDLLGRSFYPFMHPDDRGAFVAKIEALAWDHPSIVAEARVVLPDGRMTWHSWTHHVIFDSDRRIVEYQCTGRDVTELRDMEEALRESEEQYRQLFEAESDAIFLIDNERGCIVMANSAAAALYGYRIDELLSMENTALSAEPAETWRVTTGTIVHKDTVVNIPLRYHRKKDGTVFPVEITGRFFRLRERSVHISAIRDITERKRAEEALLVSESRFRTLFDDLIVVGMVIDPSDGSILDVNQAAAAYYGWSRERLRSMNISQINTLPTETISERMKAVTEKKERFYSMKHRLADGSVRDVEVYSGPINFTGRAALYSIIHDVTERRQSDEALKKSEDRFRTAFHTSPDSINITRLADGTCVSVNRGFTQIMGYTEAEAIGKTSLELGIWADPSDRQRLVDGLRSKGEVRNLEARFRTKSGTIIHGLMSASIIEVDGVPHILSVTRDISERKHTEEALRASESRTRNIIEAIPVGMHMYRLEADGRLVFTGANPAADRILGLDNSAFVGKAIEEAFPSIGKTEVPQRYREVALTGRPWDTENIEYQDNDIKGAFEVHAFGTGPDSMVAAFEDITDRMRAMEALKRSEERYRDLFENAFDAICIVDNNQNYLDVNRRAVELFGYSREEMLSMNVRGLLPPEQLPRSEQAFARLSSIGSYELFTGKVLRKDGSTLDVEVSSSAIIENGKVIGSRDIVRDITERKKADLALRESEAKYRRLYNETPVLLHSIDRSGVIIDVNDFWLKTLGYERTEVIGRKLTDFFTETSRKRARESVQPVFFEAGMVKDVAFQFVKKNGEVIDVLLSASGERDAEGKVVRSRAVMTDVTERKRAAEQIKRFSNDLQRLVTVSREMTATTDLAALYRSIVRTAADMLRFDCSSVMVLSEDGTRLIIKEAIGLPASAVGQFCLVEGQGLSTYVVRNRKAEAVVDFQTDARFDALPLVRERGIRSALCVPMMIDKEVFGVLIGHTFERREFSSEEIAIYEDIGNQAAIAIKSSMNLQSLGKSERMLQTIIDAEPECVKLLDRDANLVLMNRAGLDMIQADSLEQVKGRSVCALIVTEYVDAFMDLTRRVFQGESGMLAFEMIGAKGRRLWLETHAVPLRNEKDEIIALLGVTRDVTERMRADEALRASEHRFRTLIENAASGILVVDETTRKFLYANPLICRMLGYSADELRTLDVASIHPHAELDRVDTAFRAREGLQTLCLRKDGSIFPVEIHPTEMELEGRRCLAGFFTDITEKHLLEEERLKMQKLESLGTLAGGIAHDFNNLLQGVFGYISMAKMSLDWPDRANSLLEQAELALDRSVSLTSQLLTFSKGGKPIRKRMAVGPVIENAAKFALAGSRSDCRLDIDPVLWKIDADGGQLGQVVQNIVLNADQAMPFGGVVEIMARNVSADDPRIPQGLARRDHVMIAVRDTGVGIPAKYLARIFDPYFTTKEKGSGLGLATSYSIVSNHEGTIVVASEHGAGSVFTVWLPASHGGAEQASAASIPSARRTGRVLVMDDDEFVRDVATESLRALGHDAEVAEHGDEAIELYRRAKEGGRPFDVVILDLTVRGGKGGLETLRELREIDPEVRAVVSTGYSSDTIVSEYRSYGFSAFLKKPYDLADLSEVLGSLIA